MNNSFTLSYITIGLAALGFIYFVLCAGLRREQFRCEVRRIRDDLFDFMWENKQDFNEPAYLKARETMNGFLVLSNKLSPTVLVMSAIAAVFTLRRNGVSSPPPPLPAGLLGDKIRHAYLALTWKLIEYSFLKGIPGLFIKLAVWILSHAFHLSSRIRVFKRKIVTDGADYLQGTGVGAQSPLKFT
jgi:hypothetical protein